MAEQDSTTDPAGEPLEADLPGFGPTRKGRLDPLDPKNTTVTGIDPESPAWATTSWAERHPGVGDPMPEPTYDPDRDLNEQLLDDLDEAEPFELPDPRNLSSSS